MNTEINFDAIETFGFVLKKVKAIYCVLFGKNWRYLSKIPYFDAEYEHWFMKIHLINWNRLNLKHTVHQHVCQ